MENAANFTCLISYTCSPHSYFRCFPLQGHIEADTALMYCYASMDKFYELKQFLAMRLVVVLCPTVAMLLKSASTTTLKSAILSQDAL